MIHVGVLQFTLTIPHAASLKDKRRVVKSIKDRTRRKFNVSIAEVDDLDEWTVGTLAVVMASNALFLGFGGDRLLNKFETLDIPKESLISGLQFFQHISPIGQQAAQFGS